MAVSQWKLAWLTPNLGILWISVCSFRLCESIVANPIIYRLVPRPSRFEIRQCGSIVANPIIYRLVPGPSRFEIRQCWQFPKELGLPVGQLGEFKNYSLFLLPFLNDFNFISQFPYKLLHFTHSLPYKPLYYAWFTLWFYYRGQRFFITVPYLPTPRVQKPGDNPKNVQSGSHFY